MKRILFNVKATISYVTHGFTLSDTIEITVHNTTNSTEALIKVIDHMLNIKLNKIVHFENVEVYNIDTNQKAMLSGN